MAEQGDRKDNNERISNVRLIVGFVLVILEFLFIFSTYFWESAAVCREQVTNVGTVVTVCNPVGSDDLVFITFGLILIVLVFWPEISEVTLPGLITLKRRVDLGEKRVENLEHLVQQFTMSQNTTIHLGFQDPEAMLREASRKAEDVKEGRIPEQDVPNPRLRMIDPKRAVEEVQLLSAWEEILEFAGTRPRNVPRMWSELTFLDNAPDWVQEWRMIFRSEIDELRAVRNTIAHRPELLTDEQVTAALETAQKLLESLDLLRRRSEIRHT